MARKTKAQKAAEEEAKQEELGRKRLLTRIEAAKVESLKAHREVDALLWEVVDRIGRIIFKLMTLTLDGSAEDVASLKVRARVPTSITVAYDDGYTYHAKRRLGGTMARPVILEFEHSDPAHVGTVTEAIEYNLGETAASLYCSRRKNESDD